MWEEWKEAQLQGRDSMATFPGQKEEGSVSIGLLLGLSNRDPALGPVRVTSLFQFGPDFNP